MEFETKINLNKKWLLISTNVILLFAVSFLLVQLIMAQPAVPNPGHYANSVAAGTFGSDIGETGNYVFPGDLGVTGDVTTNNIYLNSATDWLLTGGIIKESILPYCSEEITSDVYTNSQNQSTGCSFGGYDGYYEISNLIPENVKEGIAYGRGEIGEYSPNPNCLVTGHWDICDQVYGLDLSCEGQPGLIITGSGIDRTRMGSWGPDIRGINVCNPSGCTTLEQTTYTAGPAEGYYVLGYEPISHPGFSGCWLPSNWGCPGGRATRYYVGQCSL